MKNLYMMQACDKPDGIISLPYSIGVLYSYAFQNFVIKTNYRLCGLLVEKLDPEYYLSVLEKPDVFAFSCYIWNYEYSKQLAKRIKEDYPECVIIFGGHSIPISQSELLRDLPYVDYLIHGEGEIPFQELLLYLLGCLDIECVHNISYRLDDGISYNYHPDCIAEEYPSPYLTGVFDKMFDDPNVRYNATIETNRGCPFHCAYCDWGLNQSRIRMMDLDRILTEIEWMGQHQIVICNGADSNFGMFSRDLIIANKIAETRKKYGFPYKFSVSFSKQSDERVLEISRILNSCGVLAGVTISFQSLNPKTLELIGRRNLSAEHFKKLIAQYNKENIPTYSELILGLPEESYDTFTAGISELIANGQYRYINVYDFALLVNSEIGIPTARNIYGIKTVKMPLKMYYCRSSHNPGLIREYADIVIETSTMPREDWVNCRMFTSIVKIFHSFGLLLYVASYLHQKNKINYKEFYDHLYAWIIKQKPFQIYMNLKAWYSEVSVGNRNESTGVEFYNDVRIPPEEATFLRVIENIDAFYDAIRPFVMKYLDDSIPCEDDLLRFQEYVFRSIYDVDIRNTQEEFRYDLVSYFNHIASGEEAVLEEKQITVNYRIINDLLLYPKKIYISESQFG